MAKKLFDGKYELKEVLRKRGPHMAVVRAIEASTGAELELRCLNMRVQADNPEYQRFLNEFQTLLDLEHPGLVKIAGVGNADGKPYYVTAFRQATPIKEIMDMSGPLPVAEALTHALRIADALAYLHDHQIFHRDVSTTSVHVDLANNEAFLAEFSLVKNLRLTNLTARGIGQAGQFIVTPEQMKGEYATAQTDVYLYGVFVFEMLTQVNVVKPDFTIRPLEQYDLTIPESVKDTLLRCLAVDPAERPASCREIAAVIRAQA